MSEQTTRTPSMGAGHERRVVVVGYDGIELLDVANVTSCLDLANRLGATPPYDVRFATLSGALLHLAIGTLGALHLQAETPHRAFTIGLFEPFW
jgi:hypothetical protein